MRYSYTENNIHIIDSYLITSKDLMQEHLKTIRRGAFLNGGFEYKRSNESWLREWCAHNWLYDHNIEKDRTKDVDLNENEKLWKRLGYFIIYILFCK